MTSSKSMLTEPTVWFQTGYRQLAAERQQRQRSSVSNVARPFVAAWSEPSPSISDPPTAARPDPGPTTRAVPTACSPDQLIPTSRTLPNHDPRFITPADCSPPNHSPTSRPSPHGHADCSPPNHSPTSRPSPHDHGPHDHGPHDHGPHDHGPHDHGPHDHGPHDHGPRMNLPLSNPPTEQSSSYHTRISSSETQPSIIQRRPHHNTASMRDTTKVTSTREVQTESCVTGVTSRPLVKRARSPSSSAADPKRDKKRMRTSSSSLSSEIKPPLSVTKSLKSKTPSSVVGLTHERRRAVVSERHTRPSATNRRSTSAVATVAVVAAPAPHRSSGLVEYSKRCTIVTHQQGSPGAVHTTRITTVRRHADRHHDHARLSASAIITSHAHEDDEDDDSDDSDSDDNSHDDSEDDQQHKDNETQMERDEQLARRMQRNEWKSAHHSVRSNPCVSRAETLRRVQEAHRVQERQRQAQVLRDAQQLRMRFALVRATLGSLFSDAPSTAVRGSGPDIDHMDYDQLLAWERQQGQVKEKAADVTEISILPTETYTKKPASTAVSVVKTSPTDKEAEADTCQICMNTFVDGDMIKRLPCFHKFHATEVDQWLLINRVCPVCRLSVRPSEQKSSAQA